MTLNEGDGLRTFSVTSICQLLAQPLDRNADVQKHRYFLTCTGDAETAEKLREKRFVVVAPRLLPHGPNTVPRDPGLNSVAVH